MLFCSISAVGMRISWPWASLRVVRVGCLGDEEAGDDPAVGGDDLGGGVAFLDFLGRLEDRFDSLFKGEGLPDEGEVGADGGADAFEAVTVGTAAFFGVEEDLLAVSRRCRVRRRGGGVGRLLRRWGRRGRIS